MVAVGGSTALGISLLQAQSALMELRGFWSAVCMQLVWSMGRANTSVWIDLLFSTEKGGTRTASHQHLQVWPSLPNIWLCCDSYETCWTDDCNYQVSLPDLDGRRCSLSFVLQNLFLCLSQRQQVQIQWEESLGIFDGIHAYHRLPDVWSNTTLSKLLSCWKLGSSFRATSQ